MSVFVKYLDEVEVLETWVAGWQVVDLAPYGVDPNAKAVTFRFTGDTSRDVVHCGVRDINAAYPGLTYLVKTQWCCEIVGLAGGSTVKMYMDHLAVRGRAFITGEVHGDDVVVYDENKAIDLVEADFGVWQDRQPTPQGVDVLGDIASVIVVAWQWDDGTTGIRRRDSSNIPLSRPYFGGLEWHVIGLDDDGYYQTYTTGKTGSNNEDAYFFEIGYILKTSNVGTITDWGLPENITEDNTWRVLDISPKVPANTALVGTRLRNAFHMGLGRLGFCRGIGSSDDTNRMVPKLGGVGTQMITLNPDSEFEYRVGHSFISLHITWYEVFAAPVRRIFIS